MKIAVFGAGYVGLVTSACFAEVGHEVLCVESDLVRLEVLKQGISPIYEPGLGELIESNLKAGRIQFISDSQFAIENSDILFIAVGTMGKEDDSTELSQVLQVTELIAQSMASYKVLVFKSTVPPGTAKILKEKVRKILDTKGKIIPFDLVSNPEFLSEGRAVEACLKPTRIVIGCESEKALQIMTELYRPVLKKEVPLLAMDLSSAELTKYAANAFLATKISFMNEIAKISEKLGADIKEVEKGLASDPRIGPHFISAGLGFGGSCLPKDLHELIRTGQRVGEDLGILQAVEKVNQSQKVHFLSKIKAALGSSLAGAQIAFWGAAFKPGTDDIRSAPAISLMAELLKEKAKIRLYDPTSGVKVRDYFHGSSNLTVVEDQYMALEQADCLVICTEWNSFLEPDFQKMKSLMNKPLIFDGRNIYSELQMKKTGFEYHSIGRPAVLKPLLSTGQDISPN